MRSRLLLDSKKNDLVINLSELMYLCFFCLMLFAKGIGLYDGQFLYKIFLITAFFCIGIKMCLTQYSYKEWLIILGLLVLSGIVYIHSGEKGILICMITVLGMKNVSVDRVFKVGMVVWMSATGGKFLFELMNLENVKMAVQDKNIFGAVLRYFMGFPHPNTLHISYFVLTIFIVYCFGKKYSIKHLCILMIGNLALFLYSYSLTGAIIVSFYLVLSYYVKIKKISKLEYGLVEIVFPFCLIIAIVLPVFAEGKLFIIADKVFNNRVAYSKHYLVWENITLIGNNLAEITTKKLTMDNSIVFALIVYGVVIWILICGVYLAIIHSLVKEKKNKELAIIVCCLIAGITEPFLFNTSFKNLTLIFIGEWLFLLLEKTEKGKKQFVILKDKDIKICLNVSNVKNVLQNFRIAKGPLINNIYIFSVFCATIITGIVIYRYQTPVYVLERARDSILVLERIRVGVTTFLISYIITAVFIYSIALVKEKRTIRS